MQHALYHFSLPIFSSSFPFSLLCLKRMTRGRKKKGGEEECALIDASAKKIKKFEKKGRVFPVKLICETLAGFFYFYYLSGNVFAGSSDFTKYLRVRGSHPSWIWRVWLSLSNRKRGGSFDFDILRNYYLGKGLSEVKKKKKNTVSLRRNLDGFVSPAGKN